MEGDTLYLQLHKLSGFKSQEDLEHILTTLWHTRKTGLSPLQKSTVQSLLNLQSLPEVNPVLACLRSVIRKCVHENFTSDDILKLFPPNLSLDLQSTLILLLQKYQNKWKEDISRDQIPLPRIDVSPEVNAGYIPSLSSFSLSELPVSLWPRHEDPLNRFNRDNFGTSTPITAENNGPQMPSIPLQRDVPSDDAVILPRLKSMTWKLEKRNNSPANKVAVISLKLQDYTKSPSGETEVKFQLTRDTLEAMLRSMTYISEQLSTIVGSTTGQLKKKQRR